MKSASSSRNKRYIHSMVTCLLVDCIFITFSLIIGMYSLKTTEQLKEQLDEAETKRVKVKVHLDDQSIHFSDNRKYYQIWVRPRLRHFSSLQRRDLQLQVPSRSLLRQHWDADSLKHHNCVVYLLPSRVHNSPDLSPGRQSIVHVLKSHHTHIRNTCRRFLILNKPAMVNSSFIYIQCKNI